MSEVNVRRPAPRPSATISARPSSEIGMTPDSIISIFAGLLSMQVTWWPRWARQEPVVRPTYPVPTTAILLLMPSTLLRASGRRPSADAPRNRQSYRRGRRVPTAGPSRPGRTGSATGRCLGRIGGHDPRHGRGGGRRGRRRIGGRRRSGRPQPWSVRWPVVAGMSSGGSWSTGSASARTPAKSDAHREHHAVARDLLVELHRRHRLELGRQQQRGLAAVRPVRDRRGRRRCGDSNTSASKPGRVQLLPRSRRGGHGRPRRPRRRR